MSAVMSFLRNSSNRIGQIAVEVLRVFEIQNYLQQCRRGLSVCFVDDNSSCGSNLRFKLSNLSTVTPDGSGVILYNQFQQIQTLAYNRTMKCVGSVLKTTVGWLLALHTLCTAAVVAVAAAGTAVSDNKALPSHYHLPPVSNRDAK